jgi:hypothetical protein
MDIDGNPPNSSTHWWDVTLRLDAYQPRDLTAASR